MLSSRAGLVTLFFTLFVSLAACTPIPARTGYQGLVQQRVDSYTLPAMRHAATFNSHRDITATTHINKVVAASRLHDQATRREISEIVVLYRRKSIGQKIKDAFRKVGQKIKKGFQKVGHAIKSAAKKVGHFMKETGKKIVKVALKVAAIAQKVVAKVVGFIPGVGKVLGKALEASSKGLNAASDKIKCKIGGKLGTAMRRMDKGIKVMGYIP